MRIIYLVLLFIFSIAQTPFAQQRNVSMIDGSRMFSYTITRYSPAWEIQSGKPTDAEPVLTNNSRLFKKIEDSNIHNLKNLLYTKGFVPGEVEKMNGSSMEKYLASNRLVMHYRIRYKDHTIFVAHLNDSKSRSVIPFLIDKNRWILDADFAETDFFRLISKPYFNAYTGSFDGAAICDLAFEEVDVSNQVYDYSGRGNSAQVRDVRIVNGRIGGAAKLGQESELIIDLRNERDLGGKRFSIDFHLNIQENTYNQEGRRDIFSAKTEDAKNIEVFVQDGFLRFQVTEAKLISIPYKTETWSHIKVMQDGKKLSVEVDGEDMAATTVNAENILSNTVLSMGGRNSFRGFLDEFRISK